MKFRLLLLLFAVSIFSCNVDAPSDKTTDAKPLSTETPFSADFSDNNSLTFENIRIFPIMADAEHIAAHTDLASFKNLKESIGQIKGFNIMEKKEFGRAVGDGTVNELTVYNKSQDTIIIISGDVITGGKQDRVIEQNYVIIPGTIQNIPVFCVEQGRWEYQEETFEDEEGEESEEVAPQERIKKSKDIYAFNGYVNVASNEVRQKVKYSKSQEAVWAAVGDVTRKNKAESETKTYAALEDSKEFTDKRDAFIRYFDGKFNYTDNVVGMIVVNGDKVLGTEIFNHPTLFKKQFDVMMYGYITDAISNENKSELNIKKVESHFEKVKRDYNKDLGEKETQKKFRYNGKIVHFSSI